MHMNVCKHCRTIFTSRIKSTSCCNCKEKDDLQFDEIREYLIKYPNSNALQIAEALNISAHVVLSYLNEGRLVVSKGSFERL